MDGVDHQAVQAAITGNAPEAAPVVAEPAQVEPTPFTAVDPSNLPPEALEKYKSMQADYTRKTQEIAEQRKVYESLGEVDQVKQIVEFYNRLGQEPEFAKQVVDTLEKQYGWNTPAVPEVPTPDPFEEYDLPPELVEKLSTVDSLQERLDKYDSERQVMDLAAELQRADMAVRQANPHYTEQDMERVWNLVDATQGDLPRAQLMYEEWKQGIVSEFIASKSEVPQGIAPAPTDVSHAETPHTFDSIADATTAAVAFARAAQGVE